MLFWSIHKKTHKYTQLIIKSVRLTSETNECIQIIIIFMWHKLYVHEYFFKNYHCVNRLALRVVIQLQAEYYIC